MKTRRVQVALVAAANAGVLLFLCSISPSALQRPGISDETETTAASYGVKHIVVEHSEGAPGAGAAVRPAASRSLAPSHLDVTAPLSSSASATASVKASRHASCQALDKPLLAQSAAASAAGIAIVTFANTGLVHFALNWRARLEALRLGEAALIGAADEGPPPALPPPPPYPMHTHGLCPQSYANRNPCPSPPTSVQFHSPPPTSTLPRSSPPTSANLYSPTPGHTQLHPPSARTQRVCTNSRSQTTYTLLRLLPPLPLYPTVGCWQTPQCNPR